MDPSIAATVYKAHHEDDLLLRHFTIETSFLESLTYIQILSESSRTASGATGAITVNEITVQSILVLSLLQRAVKTRWPLVLPSPSQECLGR